MWFSVSSQLTKRTNHLLASGVQWSGLAVLYNIGLCFTFGLFVMISLWNSGYGVCKHRLVECFSLFRCTGFFSASCPICIYFFQCGFYFIPAVSTIILLHTEPNHNRFCLTMISCWLITAMLVLCFLLGKQPSIQFFPQH